MIVGMFVTKISDQRKITVPKQMMDKLAFSEGDKVAIELREGKILIRLATYSELIVGNKSR
jgi:AbrB family looped-hinge helix DNA binding protein